MEDIEEVKQIYSDIISAVHDIELTHNIYCAIPPFIEFNGMIYQHYQCISEEELFKWHKRNVQQMMEINQSKVKFYTKPDDNDKIKVKDKG